MFLEWSYEFLEQTIAFTMIPTEANVLFTAVSDLLLSTTDGGGASRHAINRFG